LRCAYFFGFASKIQYMKKNIFIIIKYCSVLVAVCSLTAVILWFGVINDENTTVVTTQPTAFVEYKYYLGDYRGNLAVYNSGEDMPIEVFNIHTSSLPGPDYQRILQRIGARDEEELQLLIEEYTS